MVQLHQLQVLYVDFGVTRKYIGLLLPSLPVWYSYEVCELPRNCFVFFSLAVDSSWIRRGFVVGSS